MDNSEQQLGEYNQIVVLDASSSMGTEDMPGGRSRWAYMQENVQGFARDVGRYDSDGIDMVIFGGSQVTTYGGVTAAKVDEVFAQRRPSGGTPLHLALTEAFKLANKSDKKAFITVFTDGVPDEKAAAADVIRKQANAQATDDQCTVLFVQIGREPNATSYLKSLDDDLKGVKFDIVDTKTMDEFEQFPNTGAMILAAIAD